MILLKPAQAGDLIEFARAAAQPLVIIVGDRIEAYSVDSPTLERVRLDLSASPPSFSR